MPVEVARFNKFIILIIIEMVKQTTSTTALYSSSINITANGSSTISGGGSGDDGCSTIIRSINETPPPPPSKVSTIAPPTASRRKSKKKPVPVPKLLSGTCSSDKDTECSYCWSTSTSLDAVSYLDGNAYHQKQQQQQTHGSSVRTVRLKRSSSVDDHGKNGSGASSDNLGFSIRGG